MYDDPLTWFDAWFQEASARDDIPNPNAMVLATVDAEGRPETRVVLLKARDADGFVFYTNYASRKGEALRANPVAALNFYWRTLGRQIRVRGAVSQVDAATSDAYFSTRPRGSQIGAWASLQSQPLEGGMETLRARVAELEARFEGGPVPRPEHWGGYRLTPGSVEFWEEGAFRLHTRYRFTRGDAGWERSQLFP